MLTIDKYRAATILSIVDYEFPMIVDFVFSMPFRLVVLRGLWQLLEVPS